MFMTPGKTLVPWVLFLEQEPYLSHINLDYKTYITLLENRMQKIKDAGETQSAAKSPPLPTSFSPVTSTNVGLRSQNFLTFSFDPFVTLVQNFKFVPSASPKLLNLNQDHPSKKAVFLVKSL